MLPLLVDSSRLGPEGTALMRSMWVSFALHSYINSEAARSDRLAHTRAGVDIKILFAHTNSQVSSGMNRTVSSLLGFRLGSDLC